MFVCMCWSCRDNFVSESFFTILLAPGNYDLFWFPQQNRKNLNEIRGSCFHLFIHFRPLRSCIADHLSGLTSVHPIIFSIATLVWPSMACVFTLDWTQTAQSILQPKENEIDTTEYSFCDAVRVTLTCMPWGSASHSVQQVQWSQIKWGHVTQLGNLTLAGLTYQNSYRSVHRGTGVVQSSS